MPFSGPRLAAARRAAGLTQGQLAASVGTRRAGVSDWECGAARPHASQVPAVAAAVGLDALEFLAPDPSAVTLADLRQAAGLSVEELSMAAGVSMRRYKRLEDGAKQREPVDELLRVLAGLLAVPLVTVRVAIRNSHS